MALTNYVKGWLALIIIAIIMSIITGLITVAGSSAMQEMSATALLVFGIISAVINIFTVGYLETKLCPWVLS